MEEGGWNTVHLGDRCGIFWEIGFRAVLVRVEAFFLYNVGILGGAPGEQMESWGEVIATLVVDPQCSSK